MEDAKNGEEVTFTLSDAQEKGTGKLNSDDYNLVVKLHSNEQTITFEKEAKTRQTEKRVLSLKGLLLKQEDISQAVKVRPDSEQSYWRKISDLHLDVKIDNKGKITGTLPYVTDFKMTEEGVDGNFLALHLDKTKFPATGVTIGFEGVKFVDIDPDDWNFTARIDEDRKTKGIDIKVNGEKVYHLDLTGLKLLKDPSKVIVARDGNLPTYNKYVRDLQENVAIDTKGFATGKLLYVTDYQNGGTTDGNFIALHVNNNELPTENVEFGIGDTWADPDKNDWNLNVLVNEERKSQQIKIRLKDKKTVIYSINLSKLELGQKG